VQEDFHKSNGSPFPSGEKRSREKNRAEGAGGVELGRSTQTVLKQSSCPSTLLPVPPGTFAEDIF